LKKLYPLKDLGMLWPPTHQHGNKKMMMMGKYDFFAGIDVSKDVLDVCIQDAGGSRRASTFKNTPAGVAALAKWLGRCFEGLEAGRCLVCLEHTGFYTEHARSVLGRLGFVLWLETALCIKNGAGAILRGKDDQLDAERISDYAMAFQHKAAPFADPGPDIKALADLVAERQRLTGVRNMLKVPLTQAKGFKAYNKALGADSLAVIKATDKAIKQIERRILALLKANKMLWQIYRRLTSVKGVGLVMAFTFITVTKGMTQFNTPEKFNCHAGLAAYRHRSGSSVRRKDRVSRMADGHLKGLLRLCALSASTTSEEFIAYKARRMAEKKGMVDILNAVANKLVRRMFACLRNGRDYSPFPPPRTVG
jgi:transposase